MTTKEPANTYNYPLSTGAQGRLYYILNTDNNWTNPAKRRILWAKYGVGNVIPVDKNHFLQNVGVGLNLASLMAESYTPSAAFLTGSVSLPVVGTISLNPPTALVVLSTQVIPGSGMSSNVQITVGFTESAGATDYDVQFTTASLGALPQAVTGLTASVSGTTINATWNTMPDASNYVISAGLGANLVYAAAPVTTGSGSIVVPSTGTWILIIVPYNQLGIAGAGQSILVTV